MIPTLLRKKLLAILHAPPSDHGINRASWRLDDLQRALEASGIRIGKHALRRIIKDTGFRWRKAKKVLTSSDPDYRSKLDAIHKILAGLNEKGGFFSIDEFGPFSIKKSGGKKLATPSDLPTIPQKQRSKGKLIVTAAVELQTNQVTHFHSEKKNTTEMLKLLDVILAKYKHLDRIYLSWDAASWHISKKLFARVESINARAPVTGSALISLAPLPAGAQFLNVIEAIFSGMARAVLHNSDYGSVNKAKSEIDRYLEERNEHYRQNPTRAGKKIWGKEPVPLRFTEAQNCKDARYR